jgi:BirA family biotin operon repressor/biotin-[acetyl-CoA-carboxylase] ligase
MSSLPLPSIQPSIQPNMQRQTTLDLPRIAEYLSGAPNGRTGDYAELDYYPEVDSTMRVARALGMQSSIGSGSVVVADAQSAGRGRMGRTWEAPPGSSLLMSIILKRTDIMSNFYLFPLMAGIAVQRALAELALPGIAVGIKWPNDILLRGGDGVERKVAGVLVESTLQEEMTSGHAVIGFGINVLQDASQLPHVAAPAPPPTSLWLASGVTVDRTNLLLAVWRHFFAVLNLPPARPKAQSADPVFSLWREVSWTLGRAVTVHHADGSTLRGVAVDIDSDRMGRGALIVEDETGARHAVHAGDVSLRADAARAGA